LGSGDIDTVTLGTAVTSGCGQWNDIHHDCCIYADSTG
jgi:hypothetical protein